MKLLGAVIAIGVAGVLTLTGTRAPEVKVDAKGLHLCCGGCVSAAAGAVTNAGARTLRATRTPGR